MDGPNGGGVDSRGGVWRGGSYDATNQIKQLLRIPTEEPGKPVVDTEPRTPPQNIPGHRQGQLINEHFERSGSPSTRQQRWDNYRYHDGRHQVDSFGSPGRNNSKHGNYDQNRTSSLTYYDAKQRGEIFASPSRNNLRQGSYGDRGYGGSPRNQHQFQLHQQHRGASKDHKDMRMNGPRHLNTPMNSQVVIVSDTESPEFRPSPEVLAEMEEQFLFPLKKKSIRFPKAKYFCRLCDYHCDSLIVCRRHISDARHRKLKEAKDVETTLKNVPSATGAHIAATDKLVKSIAQQVKVTQEKTRQRREVVAELNDLLTVKVKGCRLEIVGSSVSGFCLKTSDINIDVNMDDNLNPSTALLAVKELVGKNDLYRDVLNDLSSSFPTMSFTHAKTKLRMVVGANSTSSKFTNQLLADYASFDTRVPILGVAFRYWAQLCQIDDQSRGTLPPHVFPLMVVHFLQQHQPPVLPVLHQLHPNPDGDAYLRPAELGNKWRCNNTQCVGELWLDMFRFYTIGYKMTDFVINVRQLQRMPRAEKTWSKKIAIEDPFLQKRNLTRTVSGNPVFEYIVDRFKATYKYFAIPQLSYGPLFFHIVVKEGKAASGSKTMSGSGQKSKKGDLLLESIEKAGQCLSEGSSECEMERTEDDIDVAIEGEEDEEDEDPGNMSGFEADLSTLSLEDPGEEPNDSLSPNGLSSQEEEVIIATLDELTAPILFVTPTQATKLMLQLQEDDILFRFEGKTFTMGQKPPLICGSCQKEGHCKGDCREDELPPLKRLPLMNNNFLSQLTAIFEQLTMDFEPTKEEIVERDRIVADLEDYIHQFFRGATLKLFGSSANGFGFQRSDLDICLTFKGNQTGEDIDHIKIIESLAEKLKRYRQCGHVFAITTAKVPIVKFSIRRASLEGDLSLYNTLALQNTKLLSTYTKIDHRVKCLGYAMKYFAKLCDIGDASRGSLSSYAYILMVLHFLQQCRPPVIPVLQELYDHSEPAPQLIIDGWNAWFFDDLKSLRHKWKEYGKNKESVGQLWVSMLRYYTETFNWKEHVVTIRQFAPLTRLQKLWNSRCIVIEDPFDLSHNLGAGLSRKMNTFIMKAFIRGREIFGTAISGTPLGYRDLVDYLFDSKQLTDGAPPNDRGCRFCGKIGHVQKDCPKKRLTMERREKKERQKDRREMRKLVAEAEEREGERQKEKAYQKPAQELRENESREGARGGRPSESTGCGATPTSKSPEDVATGNSTCQTSTTILDQSQATVSRTTTQGQGILPYDKTGAIPSNGPPNVGVKITGKSGVTDTTQGGIGKILQAGADPMKASMCASESESLVGSLIESVSCVAESRIGTRTGASVMSSAISNSGVGRPGVSANTALGSVGVHDWGTKEKTVVSLTSGVVSVPPGFQHLAHVQVGHTNQGQSVPEHISQGLKLSSQEHTHVSQVSKLQGPSNFADVNQHQQVTVPQPQKQQQQPQQQQRLLQQEQQSPQQQRQWDYWPNSILPQPVQLASKSLKQEPQKSKIYQTTTVSTTQNHQPQQQQQQQYPYSISPAALFHMASQAAGGQVSALLLPNVSESGNNRSGLPVSTPSSVASGGTSNSSGNGAPPPPPGFSAPIAINYQGQQVDAGPYNKLMMGSPLYRSPVSQSDGQPSVPNTVSQSFISVGQTLSGPVTGVYAVQQGSGGGQFTSMAPAVTAHTPHAFGDPSLSQQQVPFDTRHFISQQVAQDLHQGVPQGIPQSLATAVPQGVPQGVAQAIQGGPGVPIPPPGLTSSVPQGLSQNVPQGVPQGLHQSLSGGVSQVNMSSALSQGIQAVPMGHPIQQHHYPQPSYPQQGYQMTVAGPSGYYPEFVFGDPGLQNPSPSGQGPPTLPAEMMTEMTFQRPGVYDTQMQALPQYLPSSLPQHQSLMSQISQPHASLGVPSHHTSLSATGSSAAYTPGSVLYIDGEREGSQVLQ